MYLLLLFLLRVADLGNSLQNAIVERIIVIMDGYFRFTVSREWTIKNLSGSTEGLFLDHAERCIMRKRMYSLLFDYRN